jgi:hypothetical protein
MHWLSEGYPVQAGAEGGGTRYRQGRRQEGLYPVQAGAESGGTRYRQGQRERGYPV